MSPAPIDKYGETPEEKRELDSIFGTREENEAKQAAYEENLRVEREAAEAKAEARAEAQRLRELEPREDSLIPF